MPAATTPSPLHRPLDHAAAGADSIALNFGVTATDSDGHAATGTITVNIVDDVPVAHNDVNSFTGAAGAVETGNVITGANEQAGGADTLSKDAPDTVTQVTPQRHGDDDRRWHARDRDRHLRQPDDRIGRVVQLSGDPYWPAPTNSATR